ncbi:hypothetical protein LXL04_028877 [Taraxacum kok-saghyz]
MGFEPKHLQSADHICKALHKKRWSKRLQSAAKRLNGTLTCEIEGKRTEELKSEERGAEISGWRRWSGCLRRRVVLSEEAATVGGSSNRRRCLRETSSRPQTLNHVFPPADPSLHTLAAAFMGKRRRKKYYKKEEFDSDIYLAKQDQEEGDYFKFLMPEQLQPYTGMVVFMLFIENRERKDDQNGEKA